MRRSLRPHLPTIAAAVACLVVAGSMGLVLPPTASARIISFEERLPIELPPPAEDRDRDSYPDATDLSSGDRILVVDLAALDNGRTGEPYVLLGTQDDHMRFGEGAELRWRHVVDHDPLGRKAGSRGWQQDAMRTGTWVASLPGTSLDQGIAEARHLGVDGASGATWPQRLVLNVRDDRATVTLRVELWDGRPSPHDLREAWDVAVDTVSGRVIAGSVTARTGDPLPLGDPDTASPEPGVLLAIHVRTDLQPDTKQAIAERAAPILLFAQGEPFRPISGDGLGAYYGFGVRPAVYRTWDLAFNNGRDDYRLFLGDYNADGTVDHRDASLIGDIVEAHAAPRVYAHVVTGPMDQVVVQYWFLYVYNYVVDDSGRDIGSLAHSGDREFIQVRFDDLGAALTGAPSSVAYSQHYEGVRIVDLVPGQPPFQFDDVHPAVYVAGGSHASYPVPGDDRGRRAAFVGFHDSFDGRGEVWEPGNYTVEVLGNQPWHMGHLWGPATRHARDLGTSFRPLLQHGFRYPYSDPLAWERHLETVTPERAVEIFGGGP